LRMGGARAEQGESERQESNDESHHGPASIPP
jgi:hypothetical protein